MRLQTGVSKGVRHDGGVLRTWSQTKAIRRAAGRASPVGSGVAPDSLWLMRLGGGLHSKLKSRARVRRVHNSEHTGGHGHLNGPYLTGGRTRSRSFGSLSAAVARNACDRPRLAESACMAAKRLRNSPMSRAAQAYQHARDSDGAMMSEKKLLIGQKGYVSEERGRGCSSSTCLREGSSASASLVCRSSRSRFSQASRTTSRRRAMRSVR